MQSPHETAQDEKPATSLVIWFTSCPSSKVLRVLPLPPAITTTTPYGCVTGSGSGAELYDWAGTWIQLSPTKGLNMRTATQTEGFTPNSALQTLPALQILLLSWRQVMAFSFETCKSDFQVCTPKLSSPTFQKLWWWDPDIWFDAFSLCRPSAKPLVENMEGKVEQDLPEDF